MFTTIVFAATHVGLLLASVMLWALCLRLGLWWAKVQDVTNGRVVLATAIVITLQIALSVLFRLVSPSSDAEFILLSLLGIIVGVIVDCAVIITIFKARLVRALQAWLPTQLASVTTGALALLVLRPFVYEAFVLPTNAMAPTLLGQHWKGTCPECGKPNYCSPRDDRFGTTDPPLMICENFHVTSASDIDQTVFSGDRLMVAKFLTPRRWDLVVFQFPEEPASLYVKRLVGLPGEVILIQDGSVWVDGIRQTPPASIRDIEYSAELPHSFGGDLWGSANRPALLGSDEYFVLGDFSSQSMDSRVWEQGAPGHNTFAVPKSHMKGVVTHTYWPPHRWRIHH